MAKVMIWVSVLQMGNGAGWQIVGICHNVGWVGLRRFVWMANNILLGWPFWIVIGRPSGSYISFHEFLLERILLWLVSSIRGREGKNLSCIVSPVIWQIKMHIPWSVWPHGSRLVEFLLPSKRLWVSSNRFLFLQGLSLLLVGLSVGRLKAHRLTH